MSESQQSLLAQLDGLNEQQLRHENPSWLGEVDLDDLGERREWLRASCPIQ